MRFRGPPRPYAPTNGASSISANPPNLPPRNFSKPYRILFEPDMQRLATLPFALVLGVGTIFFSGCSRTPDVQARTTADVPSVAVVRVKTTNLSRNVVLTAEFKPYQEIDVMAKVAGYVKQINVDIGDRVREGQLLATLEIPEMADDRRKAQA